jgi:predicted pyridoxine 5'-phosphate oxidase superfamily flavin-nucleotide-binding protein
MGVFHGGEQEAQRRAGVLEQAARVVNAIHSTIPLVAAEFLAAQPFAVIGAQGRQGRIWASLLAGAPGFLRAEGETTLHVGADVREGDPLYEILRGAAGESVGLLVLAPATRRRMRLNGQARAITGGGFVVEAEQVYANCPKYIQKREGKPGETTRAEELLAEAAGAAFAASGCADALSAQQRAFVEAADTFFIASAHPESGADASHRGGNPGFVEVSPDGRTLLWPDYSGNSMFNTLGNLLRNPAAGLLFLNWESGGALQMTGETSVLWDEAKARRLPGAERAVSFRIRQIHETGADALPLSYRLRDYSPFNPAG